MGFQQHLPNPRQGARRGLSAQGRQTGRLVLGQDQGIRPEHLAHRSAVGVIHQIIDHHHRIGPKGIEAAKLLQRCVGGARHYLLKEGNGRSAVRQPQHVAHHGGGRGLAAIGLDNGLIEQRKCIAHRAFRRPGDQGEPFLGDPNIFGVANRFQPLDQHVRLDPAQIKSLTARQNGHRHLANFGSGEDEFDVRRRLFQGLQQGVERGRRQHVHFVDDIDLVARLDRRIARAVQQLAHLIDLGAAGGVELQHIHVPAFDNGPAMAAFVAQGHRGAVNLVGLIVQGPRQQARCGGLADAAHPGQHKGMGNPTRRERIGEGAHHGLLADQILKGARPVFARQDLIGGTGWVRERFARFGLEFGLKLNLRLPLRWRAAEHIRGQVVARVWTVQSLGVVGVDVGRRIVCGHRPISACECGVETGRRPAAKLVTAASFRT